jgi:hypothetical protein
MNDAVGRPDPLGSAGLIFLRSSELPRPLGREARTEANADQDRAASSSMRGRRSSILQRAAPLPAPVV